MQKSPPHRTFHLQVSSLHSIYVEECGTPQGIPIIFLHGGPGGAINETYRRYFDPKKWRIILFDQRGCGKSLPHSELKDNSTWDLVADMERIRNELKIKKWCLFGGSWGSTLALSYAIKHSDKCLKLFLRGIFMLRKKELDWFYQEGASKLFPDQWEEYLAPIPENERQDIMKAYYKRLTSDDKNERERVARAWSVWEASTSAFKIDQNKVEHFRTNQEAFDAFARIECHFFMNKGFFETDEWILEQIPSISHLDCFTVHGRYDVVCPLENAWELKKRWDKMELYIAETAGHTLTEKEITKVLIQQTDAYG